MQSAICGLWLSWMLVSSTSVTTMPTSAENYWDKIKPIEAAMLNGSSEQASQELRSYIESLSAEQLIIAGRQCAQDLIGDKIGDRIGTDINAIRWEGLAWFAFFFEEYPKKTDGLKNIDGLLGELSSKTTPTAWRLVAMRLLGVEWSGKLGCDQSLAIARVCRRMAEDSTELKTIRLSATYTAANVLTYAYSNNIKKDMGFAKYDELNTSTGDVARAVQSGKIRLGKAAMDREQKIASECDLICAQQVTMFSASDSDLQTKRMLIGSWRRMNRVHMISRKVMDVCSKALDEYTQYDEALWPEIVLLNDETVDNPKMDEICKKMSKDAKTKEGRRVLYTHEAWKSFRSDAKTQSGAINAASRATTHPTTRTTTTQKVQ